MNHNLYRIIFNSTRGCLMAVAETCQSQGKTASGERNASGIAQGGHSNAAQQTIQLSALQWLCWLAIGAVSLPLHIPQSQAQTTVIADPNAPRGQQPTVLLSGNNTVQVNIQTPSAAGVSRNTYKQFDVGAGGVILNNSPSNVLTRQGGWVQANPWLAKGSARVILNEINSSNPSHLKGFVEVAGQRAEVVIANPVGISVNGAGFINASRVHLTTGTPVMNAGNIESYKVQSGSVSIEGLGLDTRTADYTSILSRALQVNAGIWANELKVVTGSNQINANSLAPDTVPLSSVLQSDAPAPAFALDVSQLGGMYAGKIHLIGTEAGLGVRNAGLVQASNGPLVVSQDGWLSNSGSMQASQNLNIHTRGPLNNKGGLIFSAHDLDIQAQDHAVINTDTQDPAMNRGIQAVGNVNVNANSLDNDKGVVLAGNDLSLILQGKHVTQGVMNADRDFSLQTTGDLTNQIAIRAGRNLSVSAQSIDNSSSGEFISGNNTSVAAANDFTNRGLVDGAHTQINSNTLTNLGTGRIYGDRISIAANTLTNKEEKVGNTTTAATIASRNDLDIGAQTIVNQEHALIYSGGDMTIAGELDTNRRGTGSANSLTNSSATIESGNHMFINSADILNIDAHINIESQVSTQSITEGGNPRYDYTRTITEDKLVLADPAKIISAGNMTFSKGEFKNRDSKVLAGGLLTKSGATVDNLERMGTKTTHDVGTLTNLNVRYCRVNSKLLGCVLHGNRDETHGWQRAPVTETLNLTQSKYLAFASLNQDQNNPTITQLPAGWEVRGAGLPQSVPNTSLYQTRPDPASKYLVETDPQFTNQKTWLSSDYMLKSVTLDPAMTQKRLGDGFYEQKLIREQVAQLTGRRFLGDYTDDQAQYQALMNNALTTAQAMNLRPGIALSPTQMALLTSDMVWLVEQSITLADGSKQTVLAPQLYVRVNPGDLDGSGSLISADTINMNLTGDLSNTGTIAGRRVMNITADNIRNMGGTISADALNAVAKLDINNTGGRIEALSSANLIAGRDFNMTTTTQSSATTAGLSNFSQTGVDRVAALYVKNPGGTLSISANNNINLTAVKVDSQGSASVVAGNNINLNTVTTERTTNLNFDANNYNRSSSSKDVGSSITAANNLSMNAGNDLTAKAANVQAGGALNVNAGNDIIILAGEDKQSNASASKSTSSSWFSSTTTVRQNSSASNKAIASTFSGQSTSIVADNNLISVGGAFKGADSLLVEGKNEQKFYAAIDQSSSTSKSESRTSFVGINIDKRSNSSSQAQTTALGSKLISDKSIQVNVGKSVEFSGADITAPQTTFSNLDPNNPGSLRLNGAIETTQTMYSDKSETASVWQSQSGGGTTVQNLKQTTINGAATFDKDLQVAVQLPKVVSTSGKAPNPNTGAGSVSDVNQAAVQSQIETLSQQPGLGYLKQLMDGNAAANSNATSSNTPSSTDAANTNATGPKVQWQQVQLAHDNWNYSQQGLTPAGAALLSIAVAAYAPGLSGGIMSAAGGGAVAAGLNAGFVALQAQAAVAMVNNGGDINKTLQQLGSDQSVKNLLTTMVTAGALQGMNNAFADMSNTTNAGASGSVVSNGQSGVAASGVNGVTTTQSANAFTQNFTRNLTNNLAGAMVDSAINNKPLNADTVANALKSSLITSGMASGANAIGDAAAQGDINAFTQKVAHAVLGCAGGAAMTGNSGGCSAGAVGAVVGEMAADYYMSNQQDPKLSPEQNKANALAFAKVVSAVSGVVAGGDGDNVAAVNVAGTTGANAAENNYLTHNKLSDEEGELLRLKKQKASAQCDTNCNTRIMELETLDKLRDEQLAPLIAACEKAGRNNCKGEAIAQNFAQANGFGAESMKRETNAGSSSPFSFNSCPISDKGGCSYGPLQIAANTGMMNDFIEGLRKNPSDEAQYFYKELQAAGGVIASQNKDPAFLQTWMKLTAKDPQFVQYQIDALVNQNLYPVVEELQKIGIDFNTLNSSQKEAIFSAAVQHGAGKDSKTKGADNVMERAISVAQTDAQAPSFPTYTRQELVYGQVEDQMRKAEESQAKLVKQEKSLITQRESLITQEKSLITQQLNLERQKNQLLEQGMGASSEDVQRIQTQVKALDKKISNITEKVTPITANVSEISTKVEEIKTQINAQDQYIQEAAQYLKSQAQGSFADGEQWLKDFYAQRTQMYPAEAARYKKELDSLLKQYREEQKAKQKK